MGKTVSQEDLEQAKRINTFLRDHPFGVPKTVSSDTTLWSVDIGPYLATAILAQYIPLLQTLFEQSTSQDNTDRILINVAGAGFIEGLETLLTYQETLPNTIPETDPKTVFKANLSTVLSYACNQKQSESVKTLLKRRVDPKKPGALGRLPLTWAAQSGDLNCVKAIVESAVDATAVQALINANTDPLDAGLTALQAAAQAGHLEIVEYLIEQGASIEQFANALSRAAHGGFLEIVKLIIKKTPAEKLKSVIDSAKPVPALICAALQGHTEVVEFLISQKAELYAIRPEDGTTALEGAALKGHEGVVKALLEAGVVDKGPTFAMNCAAQKGYINIMQLLAAKGSSPSEVRECLASGIRGQKAPIHFAAPAGQTEAVQWLIDQGASPTTPDEKGLTPLHYAALSHAYGVAKLLLTLGVSPSAPEGQMSPLLLAATAGDVDMVKLLLSYGAEPNAVYQGRTILDCVVDTRTNVPNRAAITALLTEAMSRNAALIAAAQKGSIAELESLLDQPDANPNVALSYAVTAQQVESTKILLKRKADPRRLAYGKPPLTWAAQAGSLACVKALVESIQGEKAVRDFIDTVANNETALQVAAQAGHFEIVEYLIEKGASAKQFGDALSKAAQFGHLNIVKAIVKAAIQAGQLKNVINHQTADGATPLICAALLGHTDIVEYLISLGADLYTERSDGTAALGCASLRGHEGVVKALLKASVKDTSRTSAMHCAAQAGHIDIISLLVGSGSSPTEVRDCLSNGITRRLAPIHMAATCNQTEALQLLISLGANPSTPSGEGHTPLQFAVSSHAYGAAELLLSLEGVSANVPEGQVSPLLVAATDGDVAMVELLLSKKAQPNALYQGKTVLDHVMEERLKIVPNKSSIIEVLRQNGALSSVSPQDFAQAETIYKQITAKRLRDTEGVTTETVNQYVNMAILAQHVPLLHSIFIQSAHQDTINYVMIAAAKASFIKGLEALLTYQESSPHAQFKAELNVVLSHAASAGQSLSVKTLLARGADPRKPGALGKAPLTWAAIAGSLACVKALVESMKGENAVKDLINAGIDQNDTALQDAAQLGHFKIVEYLIAKGASSKQFGNALSRAAQGGFLEIVKLIVNNTPAEELKSVINHATPATALICAAMQGHTEVVKYLASIGADLYSERSQQDKSTALACASLQGHEGVVQALLEAGAVDKGPAWAMDCAAQYGHINIMQRLADKGSSLIAVRDCQTTTGIHRCAPIHMAATAGKTEVVQWLISQGASPTTPDDNGLTPLHFAASSHAYGVAKLLLSLDVSPNVPAGQRSPLLLAATAGDADMVKLLLSYRADLKAVYQGRTILDIVRDTRQEVPNKLAIIALLEQLPSVLGQSMFRPADEAGSILKPSNDPAERVQM